MGVNILKLAIFTVINKIDDSDNSSSRNFFYYINIVLQPIFPFYQLLTPYRILLFCKKKFARIEDIYHLFVFLDAKYYKLLKIISKIRVTF